MSMSLDPSADKYYFQFKWNFIVKTKSSCNGPAIRYNANVQINQRQRRSACSVPIRSVASRIGEKENMVPRQRQTFLPRQSNVGDRNAHSDCSQVFIRCGRNSQLKLVFFLSDRDFLLRRSLMQRASKGFLGKKFVQRYIGHFLVF